MKLKRILKYALVFIAGVIVGLCVMHKLDNDALEAHQKSLWPQTWPVHEDVFPPKKAPKDTINVPARQIYDESIGKYIKTTCVIIMSDSVI